MTSKKSTTGVETLTGEFVPADVEFRLLPTDSLVPHAHNVRRSVGDVAELAASIKSSGVHEPLIVQPNGVPDRWVSLAGHRRHAAAQIAKVESVPCLIRRDLDEVAQRVLMLTENTQRADLDPLEEADGVQGLLDLGLTDKDAAAELGWSLQKVRRRRKIAALPPPVKARIDALNPEVPVTLADAEFIAADTNELDVRDLTKALGTRDWATTKWLVAARRDARAKIAKVRASAKKLGIASGTWPDLVAATRQADDRFGGRVHLAVETNWHCRSGADEQLATAEDSVAFVRVSPNADPRSLLTVGSIRTDAVLMVWVAGDEFDDPVTPDADSDSDPVDEDPAGDVDRAGDADTDAGRVPGDGPPQYPGAVAERERADRDRQRTEAQETELAAQHSADEQRLAATAVRRRWIAEQITTASLETAQAFAEFAFGALDAGAVLARPDLLPFLPIEDSGQGNDSGRVLDWVLGHASASSLLCVHAFMILQAADRHVNRAESAQWMSVSEMKVVVGYVDLLEQCGHVLSSSEVAYRDELLAALDDAGEDA